MKVPAVYQCRKCREVVGDSLALVSHDEEAGKISLSRGVSVQRSNSASLRDLNGLPTDLKCRNCNAVVGSIVTVPNADRTMFSFDEKAVSIYKLGSNGDEDEKSVDQDNMITALQIVVIALDKRISVLENDNLAGMKRARMV
mmetsp:Transcript_4495/g.13630  ORF Transcript_4495/g.13630 Transcript_4495/m.13630 type:complete len:142 (+) Transcript_4495:77-502(+)